VNKDLTENVTANIPKDVAEKLNELVKKSGISRSRYVAVLIGEAVQKQRVFRLKTSVVISEL